ncbi:hypothetical protein AB0F32_05765 [Streptomyces albidoflavus]|uniref:Integral membrane protein n=2 Tax=Streptomyces TaxID=1883 RepID=A0ABR4S379_9ACTN|nr:MULTISPECIES: hypothetical protein [Streptomyces]KDR60083.1 hypothetical protein DC60_22140 [Streptomyces wadayamensis]QXQ26759.1 hypothetical protein STALF2_19690 [Streptomyces albidoflavus]QXQ32687.1 hypothetical protein STALF4_19760 [Streptomyces albidoflavus]RZE79287.1 hypothetical protein C0Q99_11045 [Streptomyces albidoflavus]WTB63225.1 hypothetical protein OIF23_11005 [Streptomyces albidoflavus]
MHSTYPAAPKPQGPSREARVWLRVLFTALAVMSCGFFAFGALIRLACLTRRPRDWVLTGISATCTFLAIGMMPDGDDSTTILDDLAVGLILLNMVSVVTYYLTADIRHDRKVYGTAHPGVPGPHLAGPYPPHGVTRPATAPLQHHPYPQPPHQPHPQQHYNPPTAPTGVGDAWARPQSGPAPTPAGPRPAPGTPPPGGPARIDQVRAELDELSAYLRDSGGQQGDGRGNGSQEGSR